MHRRGALFWALLFLLHLITPARSPCSVHSPAVASPSFAAQLIEIVECINSFNADFAQTGEDGSVQYGRATIRPGLLRFDYHAPISTSIVIKNGWMTFYDQALKHYSYIKVRHPIVELFSATNSDKIKQLNILSAVVHDGRKTFHIIEKQSGAAMVASFAFAGCSSAYISELSVQNLQQGAMRLEFYNVENNPPVTKKESRVASR
ncbi:hypothetical protein AM1067 [Anaplasma marginale str. St. Maries]|uniref:Outer membrane lipoprotein carrier protein LolA n=1 Tax=Anaplasma marginale (strain Florida) TaxID=320483 RepID=B9KGT4_ANAMF|nr:hypothetical protein AM1067 [Anaplasma marginale str. St. Maries]ACM49638.1 Conserved hypothetical protein [Anaplasma marginale str. Florida]